jgi:hypothetical protein
VDELKGNTERRLEELGLEEFFGDYVRLQKRVDDLESTLARVLQGLVGAETQEERLAAVELADVLPTIRVHRQRLAG